jgi:hypothetical protein
MAGIVFAAGTCLADDCRFLNRDPLELRDRQVFFRTKVTDPWTALDRTQLDLTNQSANLPTSFESASIRQDPESSF